MQKNLYYTPDEVLKLVYTGADGKLLISKGSLQNMIRRGEIPSEQLGMKRRYFIPSGWVDMMLAKASGLETEK